MEQQHQQQQQQQNASRLSGHFEFPPQGQTIDPSKVFGGAAPTDVPMFQEHFFDRSASPHIEGQGFPQDDYTLYSNAGEQPQVHHSPYLSSGDPASNVNPQDIMNTHNTPPMHLSPQPDDITAQEWSYINEQQQFQQYRRAPSEISDISSANVPYMAADYSNHPSPLITAEGTSMTEFLQMDSFNLSDTHSPIMSPRLSPYHSRSASPYNMPADFQFPPPQPPPPMQLETPVVSVSEHEQPIQGPSIMVEFAPPQRQPTFPNKPNDESALTVKTPGRRPRSVSDPNIHKHRRSLSRPISPVRAPAEDAGGGGGGARGMLSPADAMSANAHRKHMRRLSAPDMPDRDTVNKLMNLAGYPNSNADSKRVQKHPATYQCHLCTKRFTRAYNLRSHLRTHTDDRPFVCTVCGKAFARQHDRKRHEGLHTGEKKYVCAGRLSSGESWGCNRRFARADALGRHFRSEAGRICIRPLLEEEKARAQLEPAFGMNPGGIPSGMPPGGIEFRSPGGFTLPGALLEQYPVLASIDWDAGGPDVTDERSDVSGNEWEPDGYISGNSNRNSFDGDAWRRQQEAQGQVPVQPVQLQAGAGGFY